MKLVATLLENKKFFRLRLEEAIGFVLDCKRLGSRLILERRNSFGVIVILEEARRRTRSYVVLVLSLNSPCNCKNCVHVVLRRDFGRRSQLFSDMIGYWSFDRISMSQKHRVYSNKKFINKFKLSSDDKKTFRLER